MPGSTRTTSSTRTGRPSSSRRRGTCGTGETSATVSRRRAWSVSPWSTPGAETRIPLAQQRSNPVSDPRTRVEASEDLGRAGRRLPRSGSPQPSRSASSLRRELLARELDLVGEDDELLAAVEAHGEELAAEVLAQRDERPRRGSANDDARERDRARQAAARPWNDRHGCSVRGSGGEGGQIEPRPFERPTETHVAPVHHPDDGGDNLGLRARVLGDRIHEIEERDVPYHCRALRLGADRKFDARRAPKVPKARLEPFASSRVQDHGANRAVCRLVDIRAEDSAA